MDGEGRIRVLVVDDSAFARKVIREVLSREPRVEVVDVARDGLDALEKIQSLRPDVVTLDLLMPNLDGVGVLRALPQEDRPSILVVSFSDADTELGAEALSLGAADIVKKPTALATDRMYELSGELLAKIRVLAESGTRRTRGVVPAADASSGAPALPSPSPEPVFEPRSADAVQLVAVGTSTGGPAALTHLCAALPANLPVPVLVALHIPAGYTAALAARLDAASAIRVREAEEGMPLLPGTVNLAPGGFHLKVRKDREQLLAQVDLFPHTAYTPSVDVLFETAAAAVGGKKVLGVVLTGMGDDGVKGARVITGQGGSVLTEASHTCVVDGMPRSIREAGLSSAAVGLGEMGRAIVQRL